MVCFLVQELFSLRQEAAISNSFNKDTFKHAPWARWPQVRYEEITFPFLEMSDQVHDFPDDTQLIGDRMCVLWKIKAGFTKHNIYIEWNHIKNVTFRDATTSTQQKNDRCRFIPQTIPEGGDFQLGHCGRGTAPNSEEGSEGVWAARRVGPPDAAPSITVQGGAATITFPVYQARTRCKVLLGRSMKS